MTVSSPVVAVAAVVAAALAAALVVPPRARAARGGWTSERPSSEVAGSGWLVRHRYLWALLAAAAAVTLVGGGLGVVLAPALGAGVLVIIGRAEPPEVRRRRELMRRDLPAVVTLLAAALRSGAAPGEAAAVVATALPGPASDRLAAVSSRLRMGGDPALVWGELGKESSLAPLGRTMERAQATGAPVVAAVERLAADLAADARAEVEDRARAVGVKAALPLGLCLLPAFVLIGIVPLVAGLLSGFSW